MGDSRYGMRANERGMKMGKTAYAGPWIGELGWEIMVWQAYLRLMSHDLDKMIISTFPGMEALYTDFHCDVEFMPHDHPGRALEWRDTSMVATPDFTSYTAPVGFIKPIKQYRAEGEFVRYGTPKSREIEILFHARGISKASFKNYPEQMWAEVASGFPKAASIGTERDHHIPGTEDRRGIPLQDLMDLIAGAQVVVGQSSGAMHLATLCGTRHVVWGDDKTYFSEPLEKRYRETWNPFGTPVTWVDCDNWRPPAEKIVSSMLAGGRGAPVPSIIKVLKQATESGRYMVAIAYIKNEDDKETIETTCETVDYPNGELLKSIEELKERMDALVVKSGAAEETKQKVVSRAWQ